MAIQDDLPKSRITLTYRTTINGEPETVKLPLRMLVLGDFSHNTSVDRLKKDEQGAVIGEVDLDARRMRSVTGNNLNSVMKDMGIKLRLEGVRNWVRPDDGDLDVELPVTGMKSFHPDEIINHEPNLKTLLLFRKLLEEMQSNIDNRKGVRKAIQRVFENLSNEEFLRAIQGTESKFNGLMLPSETSDGGASPAAAASNAATKAKDAKAAFEAPTAATDGAKKKAATDAAKAFEAAAATIPADAPFADAKTAANAAKTAADAAIAAPDDAKFTAAATKFGEAVTALEAAVSTSMEAARGKVVADAATAAKAASDAFAAANTATDAEKPAKKEDALAAAAAFDKAATIAAGAADAVTKDAKVATAKDQAQKARAAAEEAKKDAAKFDAAKVAFDGAKTAFEAVKPVYVAAVQQESEKALTEIFSNSSLDLPKPASRTPLITTKFQESATIEDPKLAEANRLLSALSALFLNVKPVVEELEQKASGTVTWKRNSRFEKGRVAKVIEEVDELLNLQMNEILHHKDFQRMESTWRGLDDLVQNTNFNADITIDILDVHKDELAQDFENNSSDIFSGALFEKVYIHEYDQYGGRPFGTMIGLYEFTSTPKDLDWLQRMGKLANAAHCPFITAADPKFFKVETARDVEAIKDLDGHMDHPKFSKWNKLRDTEEGAYIGLTFPRYILRLPWHPEKNPCDLLTNFEEDTREGSKEEVKFDPTDDAMIKSIDAEGVASPDDPRKKAIKDTRPVDQDKYLWGNSAILFARNLVKAFEIAGWCQAIRGPKGGGLLTGLSVDTFPLRGQDEIMPPVEIAIPDYREYEFAKSGFIPLVYRKSSGDACFFSTQSIKLSKKFKDPKDSENSQLVTNLAYTFSITRLAHYIKTMMRDNIGSTADDVYIQQHIESWLAGYVTTVANPDDLTVRRFPFKATTVEVISRPGEIGWYDCKVAVLPHIQFEGLNVTLMLESRLGSAK